MMYRLIYLSLCLFSLMSGSVCGQDRAQLFEKILSDQAASHQFSGAVLLAEGDQIVFQRAIGLADREQSVPVRLDSKFRIASVTKAFTAVLIMQLIEEGKLTLETPIAELLPELKIKGLQRIDLRDLLMHYSGVGSEGKLAYTLPYSPEMMLTSFGRSKLKKPGEEFNYSNLDYLMLTLIIEKYREAPYAEVLDQFILQPAGMKNSGLLAKNKAVAGTVKNYQLVDSTFHEDLAFYIENMQGAGAMYSTLADLFQFDRALQDHRLISAATTDLMYTPRLAGAYVASGSWVYNYPFVAAQPYTVERRGGILGANSLFMRFPKANKTLIILSNNDQFDPDEWGKKESLKYQLVELLFGEVPERFR